MRVPDRSSLSARQVGVVTFTVVLLVVLAHNRFIFTEHRYEDGDFAANAILIDRARHLGLLIGNYSRVGFFHPGPALLYAQAMSQVGFHDLIPLTRTAFGAHVLGIVLLNATLIAISAAIIFRNTRSLLGPSVLVLGAFVYAGLQPGLLSSTWMPNVYVWPFLLLLVSAASVLAGNARDLWAVLLADGLLVHGHVSFVMFTVVISAIVAASVIVRSRRARRWEVERSTTLACVAIITLFAFPIVLNLVVHWPGQFQKYIDYTSSDTSVGHSLPDALHFTRLYWSSDRAGVLFAIVLFAIGAALATTPPRRSFTIMLLAQVPIATGLVVVYAMRGVDDLEQRYVATFYYVVPVVLGVALALSVVQAVREGPLNQAVGRRVVLAVLCVTLGLAATSRGIANPYPGAAWLPDASEALDREVGATTVALRFDSSAWPPAAGVLEYERRAGREICVEDPFWALVFTTEVLCDADQLRSATLITVQSGSATPAGRVVFSDPSVVLSAPR